MDQDDLFEDYELHIIHALGDGTDKSRDEFVHFLTQVYRTSRNFQKTEQNRSRARGKLISLLGALQQLSIPQLRIGVQTEATDTHIIESPFEDISLLRNPYALLLCTDEFPLTLLTSVKHFNDAIQITSSGGSYTRRFFANPKFSKVRCLFHPSLELETAQPLSATADPFTPLILIDPFISTTDQSYRDVGSILFDIILQLKFIQAFTDCESRLDKKSVRCDMYTAGAEYAEDLFNHYLQRGVDEQKFTLEVLGTTLNITPESSAEAEEHAAYTLYLAETLFRNAVKEICTNGGTFVSDNKSAHPLTEHQVVIRR